MPAIASYTKNGKSEKDRLAEGEAMLSDRIRGMRPSAMMEKYGVSQATLYRRLDAAVAARLAPTVDKYREQQNAVLDDLMARWEQQVSMGEEVVKAAIVAEDLPALERGAKMRVAALDGILRLVDRRARLNGLDMPVRVETSVVVETERDRELAEMVREARARLIIAETADA